MNSHGASPPVRHTLESIYRDHRQGLFTVALSITRQADRAEDAVHDAFARLCRGKHQPTGDPVAYAYAAVRNAAIDITRQRGSMPLSLTDESGSNLGDSIFAADAVDDPLVAGESQVAVRKALEALPVEQRDVMVMKIYGNLTFDQIAQAMGEPLATVSSRYRRALEKLRQPLESLV